MPTVVVPWRPTSPERVTAWLWVRRWWAAQGLPVVECDSGHPVWNKASSVNLGVKEAPEGWVLVADADAFLDRPLAQAWSGPWDQAHWVIPHTKVIRLDQVSTEGYLARDPGEVAASHAPPPGGGRGITGCAGGGLFLIRRCDFLAIGGMDPTFRGWGGEDTAFGAYADTLIGPHHRGKLPLMHLYHNRAARQHHANYAANKALNREYGRRRGNLKFMKKLRPDVWTPGRERSTGW